MNLDTIYRAMFKTAGDNFKWITPAELSDHTPVGQLLYNTKDWANSRLYDLKFNVLDTVNNLVYPFTGKNKYGYPRKPLNYKGAMDEIFDVKPYADGLKVRYDSYHPTDIKKPALTKLEKRYIDIQNKLKGMK